MRTRILTAGIALLASLFLAAPASAAPPDWLDTGTTWRGPGNNGVKVLGLRFASHPTFDRVVIDLRGPLPDYRTGYARRPGFDTLKALALGGDFEGQVAFAFALRHRAYYRVQHLTGPSRMVIDFRHR